MPFSKRLRVFEENVLNAAKPIDQIQNSMPSNSYSHQVGAIKFLRKRIYEFIGQLDFLFEDVQFDFAQKVRV